MRSRAPRRRPWTWRASWHESRCGGGGAITLAHSVNSVQCAPMRIQFPACDESAGVRGVRGRTAVPSPQPSPASGRGRIRGGASARSVRTSSRMLRSRPDARDNSLSPQRGERVGVRGVRGRTVFPHPSPLPQAGEGGSEAAQVADRCALVAQLRSRPDARDNSLSPQRGERVGVRGVRGRTVLPHPSPLPQAGEGGSGEAQVVDRCALRRAACEIGRMRTITPSPRNAGRGLG